MKPIEWGHKSMADAKKRYEILFKKETLHKLPNWSRFGSSYSPTVGGFGHKNPDDQLANRVAKYRSKKQPKCYPRISYSSFCIRVKFFKIAQKLLILLFTFVSKFADKNFQKPPNLVTLLSQRSIKSLEKITLDAQQHPLLSQWPM